MQKIDSAQTSNNYTPAVTLENIINSSGGSASISGADVFVQLQYGKQGLLEWTEEVHVPAGALILSPGTTGVRFRSFISGTPATISASLSSPVEPPITITSSGSSVPIVVPGSFNVKDPAFGAKGDGITNDTAAFVAWAAAINAAPLGAEGTIPAGVYLVGATINFTNRYITIQGAGWGATQIQQTFDGDLFTFTGAQPGTSKVEVSDFWVVRTGPTTTGVVFKGGANLSDAIFSRIIITNGRIIFRFGILNTDFDQNIRMIDVKSTIVDGGRFLFVPSGGFGGSYWIERCEALAVSGAAHTSSIGIELTGPIDVFYIVDTFIGAGLFRGIRLAPGAATFISDWWIRDTLIDSIIDTAFLIEPSAGGQVSRGLITGSWFEAKFANIFIRTFTGATVFDIRFGSGCQFLNGAGGINQINAGASKIRFDFCDFYDALTTKAQVEFNTSDWSVKNCYMGAKYAAIPAGTFGISVGAGFNNYEIVNCDLSQNANAIFIGAGSLDATTRIVGNKPIIAVPTIASAATITVAPNDESALITGVTNISTINIGWAGRKIILMFASALSLVPGGNLAIAANRVILAGDSVSLESDGTSWYVR
jgi:hypothetical protein